MNPKKELTHELENLGLDQQAALLMEKRLRELAEDMEKDLPDEKREALMKDYEETEANRLETLNSIRRLEDVLGFLTKEERNVLEKLVIQPAKNSMFEMCEALHCEPSTIYRTRARALRRLGRLRYGAGWKE